MQAFTRMDMVETERGDGVKERGMQAGRYVDFSLTQTEVKCESCNVLPITTDWRGGVRLERHPLHLYQFIEPAQCSHSPLPPAPPLHPFLFISFHRLLFVFPKFSVIQEKAKGQTPTCPTI